MRLSDHYELQSMTDIGRAQAIAMTDQSGHALGTAMYLAQQSVEKQLKSIVLRMDEALNLGSVDRVLRGLSHEFYPRLYEWYYTHLEHDQLAMIRHYERMVDVGLSRHEVESFASHFREASDYWEKYRADPHGQNLTWRQSLGIRLSEEDMLEMNSLHRSQMEFVQGDASGSGDRDLEFADSVSAPDRIRLDIMDKDALALHCVIYAATPANSHTRMVLADTFEEARMSFLPGFKKHYAGMQPVESAKKAIFEFGFRILASMTHQYVLLYPHNTIGRYPEPECAGFSTDVYERQASFVLAHLFVTVPHHLRVLRTNSELIDSLSDMGRQLGYWKARPAQAPGQSPRADRERARHDGVKQRRCHGHAVDMGALAERYARQADSDMRHAHAAARADRSGYALADAMLLGQQSLEKRLKAAVLMVAGMLGAGGALDLPGAREHDVYSWAAGIYGAHVDGMRVPCPPPETAPGFGGHARAIRGSAGFWVRYSRGRGLQELAWLRSIGAPMGKGGGQRLDRAFLPYVADMASLARMPDAGIPQLAREAAPGESLKDAVTCPGEIAARVRAHMRSRWNSALYASVERHFAAVSRMQSREARGQDAAGRGALRGRLAAEFCLPSLAMLGPGCLHAYPHNALGRYPGNVRGGVTTDLYKSHADGVRHLLFVDIPCQAKQVSHVAALAMRLWRGRA